MFLLDSHAHLSGEHLYKEAPAIMERAEKANVKAIVDICTDRESLERSLELQKQFPGKWFITAATTPHDAAEEKKPLKEEISKLAQKKQIVAIGETGLDFTIPNYDRDLQVVLLEMYAALAIELQLPMIFHCRGAFDALFDIGKSLFPNVPCAIHCFTGTRADAKKALDLGWNLSISGIVTFPKSIELQEIVPYIPLDHMFLETDSPYLAPVPNRGKTCEPAFIMYTAKMVAMLRGVSVEEVAFATAKNAIRFLKLPIALME